MAAQESYDSNTNRTPDNKVAAWETKLTPSLTFNSKGAADAFILAYAPSYRKNFQTHGENIDHDLHVGEHAQLAASWLLELSEKFIQSDDAAGNADTAFLDATKLKRNRFATNIANLNTTVIIGPKSSFGLGYTNTVLENDVEDQADYVRHEPTVSFSWQTTPQLQTSFSYKYSYGDFSTLSTLKPQDPAQPQDVETHTDAVDVKVLLTPHSKFSVSYLYIATRFKTQNATPDREPYQMYSGTMRLDQDLSATTSYGLFGGPSLVDHRDTADTNSYNYGFEVHHTLQNGNFLLSGKGGIDEQYFNGTNNGLTRFWSAMSSLKQQLTAKLAVDISGSVQQNTFINQKPEGRETNYTGQVGFSYTWQWFTASLSSQYYKLKKDKPTTTTADAGYDGYKFYFTLSAGKELLHWL